MRLSKITRLGGALLFAFPALLFFHLEPSSASDDPPVSSSDSSGSGSGSIKSGGTPHNKVQYLTEETFDDAINDPANGLWFLKFYAPWCGHCKKLVPILAKMAPHIAGKMAIGKIDCTKEKNLCNRFNVRGYPTLKIYRDGEFFDYPGKRDADSIIAFAERMSAAPVTLVGTYDEALVNVADKSNNGVGFIAYDPGVTMPSPSPEEGGDESEIEFIERTLQSTKLTQVFRQVARKEQAHARFGLLKPGAPSEEIAKLNSGGGGGSAAGGPFIAKIERDAKPRVYGGEIDSPDVLDFVRENNLAVLTSLGAHNFRAVGSKGKPLVIGVVDSSADDESADKLKSELKEYAQFGPSDHADKFIFAWIDGKRWGKFVSQFNVDSEALPDLVAIDVPKRIYWKDAPSEGAATPSSRINVKDFVHKIASGEIKPEEQASPDRAGGPLKKLERLFMRSLPYSMVVLVAIFAAIAGFVIPSPVPPSLREEENAESDQPTAEKKGSEGSEKESESKKDK